jgi:ankyrin repeat protein/superfamily II DNA or RNA helicase
MDKLEKAIKNGDLDQVKNLVSQGNDIQKLLTVDSNEEIDENLFFVPFKKNDLKMVKYLIDQMRYIDSQIFEETLKYGNMEIVKLMVDKGGYLQDVESSINNATESGNIKLVEFLIDFFRKDSYHYDYENNVLFSSVNIAAVKGDMKMMGFLLNYLKTQGENTKDVINNAFESALYEENNLDMVKYLVSQGADINNSADIVIKEGNLDTLKYLISIGLKLPKNALEISRKFNKKNIENFIMELSREKIEKKSPIKNTRKSPVKSTLKRSKKIPPKKELKPCKGDQVRSPISNRCVKIGGAAYKKAFPTVGSKDKVSSTKRNRRPPTKKSKVLPKPCKDGQIRSVISNRCVKIGGAAYKKAFPGGHKTPIKSPKKTPITSPIQYDINTDLIEACEYGDLELVKDVIELGADISTQDGLPLVMASKNGHLDIVKYLVFLGADIHARKDDAVIWACGGGYLNVVKYLVSEGADFTAQENDCLILACENGHIPVIEYLMLMGVNITAYDNNAVIMSANNGQLAVVKYLVSLGANPCAQNNKALEYAKSEGHTQVVNYLENICLKGTPKKGSVKKDNCVERSNVPLKPYQKAVVEHLNTHRGVLAIHGIGTGKTLTGVTASVCFLDKNPNSRITVISPAGLIANFKKGMELYGISPNDSRYSFYSFEFFSRKLGKIQITDTMVSILKKLNLEINADCSNNMLIVDEAHKLRTGISQTASFNKKTLKPKINGYIALAVLKCAIMAKKVLLLTATPFVNDIQDLNNLIAMVKGKEPLSDQEWEAVFSSKVAREKYLKDTISVYFREENDPNYPKRINKNVDIIMSDKFLKEYMKLEAKMPTKEDESSPWAFMAGMRTGLLRMKIDDKNKIYYTVDLIREKNKEGKKVVVYSNFIESGVKDIQKELSLIGIHAEIFSGETNDTDRKKYVNEYNADNLKVLLLSSAGGAGLDLKGTNAIVILDPPWNEANLEQAIGRAIRYESHSHLPDSERYVEVYQLFNIKPEGAPGRELSVDSMIKALIHKKEKLAKNVVAALKNISINDMTNDPVDETLWSGKEKKEKKEKKERKPKKEKAQNRKKKQSQKRGKNQK